jgi:hypothetical protein
MMALPKVVQKCFGAIVEVITPVQEDTPQNTIRIATRLLGRHRAETRFQIVPVADLVWLAVDRESGDAVELLGIFAGSLVGRWSI